MTQINYDLQRIKTLLHYEKIPGFILSDEQIAYLEGYRAQLGQTETVSDNKAQQAGVFDELRGYNPNWQSQIKTETKNKTTKKNSRKITRKSSKK